MELLKVLKNKLDNNCLVYLDKLLKRPNIENGLIVEKIKKISKRGDFGIATIDLSGSRIIKEDGNLEDFCPDGEQQNITFEKMWCVSENGVANQIETVINYFIHQVNNGLADKETQGIVNVFNNLGFIKNNKCLIDTSYVAVGSGTTARGNSFQKVADFVRKYGLIPKGLFPNYGNWRNWNELYYGGDFYINGNKSYSELLKVGKKLVEKIDFSYCWYPKDSKEANKKGCPGTSTGAWSYPDNEGIYKPVGIEINHAVNRPKMVGNTRLIFDSYNPFKKKLSLDYPMGMDFLISIRLKDMSFAEIKKLISKGYKFVMRTDKPNGGNGQIYRLSEEVGLVELTDKDKIQEAVKEMANNKQLTGISEELYKKLQ